MNRAQKTKKDQQNFAVTVNNGRAVILTRILTSKYAAKKAVASLRAQYGAGFTVESNQVPN